MKEKKTVLKVNFFLKIRTNFVINLRTPRELLQHPLQPLKLDQYFIIKLMQWLFHFNLNFK